MSSHADSACPQSKSEVSRRQLLKWTGSAIGALGLSGATCRAQRSADVTAERFEVATFSADVTPLLGHPLLGGATSAIPAKRIEDPLLIRGLALLGPEPPLVIASIDWCEIRNDAFDCWRDALAEAAGTDRSRVLFTCVHQHDAPLADLEAQRILERRGLPGRIIDLEFHEACVQSAARALRDSLTARRRVTHVGIGQARAEQLASNRRYLTTDGRPVHDRNSGSGGLTAQRNAPDGTIDPWLRALSFWDGDQPVCVLSSYAIHPMSYWGQGGVTSDFPGLARERRQADMPDVFQIYASGASGNVTAGKYNDASRHENRPILTQRLYRAMVQAWDATERYPLAHAKFRSVPLPLKPRDDHGLTAAELSTTLAATDDPRKQCFTAMGLSWRRRMDAGHVLDLPAIDFGPAQVLLLPGESYVEFQLFAQQQRPNSFVMVLGYGECGTGYVPIERAWAERDKNIDSWGWVAPGSEAIMHTAITAALASHD